jgi:hypothetical protein
MEKVRQQWEGDQAEYKADSTFNNVEPLENSQYNSLCIFVVDFK